MRETATAIAASLALMVQGAATPPARPVVAAMDRPFTLKVGATARIESENLEIEFLGVVADSRCPKGVQCAWAGDATVRLRVTEPGGARTVREVHTSGRSPGTSSPSPYAVRVVGLAPVPVADRATAPDSYVATLEVTRAAPEAPER